MRMRYSLFTLVVLACVVLAGVELAASAQTAPDPRLAEVLARLDANRIAYSQTVPNFFCSEHVVSLLEPQGSMQGYQRTVTDSVFRLRRTIVKQELILDESRVVKTIDGKAPANEEEKLHGPSVLSGVFSSGLEMVSTPSQACFRYSLKTHRSHGDLDRITVDYFELPPAQQGHDCPAPLNSSGRVTIDPVSMQILRVERRVPKYNLLPGMSGPWSWIADYGQVQLGDKLFWMPIHIRSLASADQTGAGGATGGTTRRGGLSSLNSAPTSHFEWKFVADYTDFHRTSVSARIVGDATLEAAPAPVREKQ